MENHDTIFNILLQDPSPSHSQYIYLAENIARGHLKVDFNEDAQDQFLLSPRKFSDRLNQLFNVLLSKELNEAVASQLSAKLLLPLVSRAYQIESIEDSCCILTAGLPLVSNSSVSSLQQLLEAISETGNILERIVTDAKGSEPMKALMSKIDQHSLNPKVLNSITHKLMALCDSCTYNHGTEAQSEQWQALLQLKTSLGQLQSEYESYNGEATVKSLPTLSNLILLEKDNKKENIARTKYPNQIPSISEETLSYLNLFGLTQPHSLRTLDTITKCLETEKTLLILKSIIETFPCRPCNEAARSSCEAQETAPINTTYIMKNVENTYDSDMFGKRVGVWKILLSSQAMKDLRNVSNSGMHLYQYFFLILLSLRLAQGLSTILKNKLEELAKGDWAGRSLSYPIGSEVQKKKMRVPVLRANCARKFFILWQVDVGIYDDLDHVRQLVKGTSQTIPPSSSSR